MDSANQSPSQPDRPPLSSRERRVLGVLVEKQKTTPEYYPMTINAIVTACNQKSNRDPVTNFDADDAEEILQGLRKKGATTQVEGSGRTVKWKHDLYEWLGLKHKPNEMAILAELMLRGAQTEGDLRARASRMMNPVPDMAGLQAVLEDLIARGLVVQLSPPGTRRGVVVMHALGKPEELERARQIQANAPVDNIDDAPPPRASSARPETGASAGGGWAAEAASLRAEIETLKNAVNTLTEEVRELKAALGA
ncbi:YceH family protein [Isosphaeraceae bacterium EP7]